MKNFYINEHCEKLVRKQIKLYLDQTAEGYVDVNGAEAFLDGAYRGGSDCYMLAIDQLVAYMKEAVKSNPDIMVSEILEKIKSEKK